MYLNFHGPFFNHFLFLFPLALLINDHFGVFCLVRDLLCNSRWNVLFTFHSLKAILSKKKIVFRYVNTVYLGSMVITMRSIRAAGSEVEHFHGSVMYLGLSGNFYKNNC